MDGRSCRTEVINANIIQKHKSSVLLPSQEARIHRKEHNSNHKEMAYIERKDSISAFRMANYSKYRSIFGKQRYWEQEKCLKDGLISRPQSTSSNAIQNRIKLQLNKKLNKKRVIKLKEKTAKGQHNRNMNNNMNDDLYLSNYNISSYISRTDTCRLLIREQIKLRKEHCIQPSLALALISKRAKHYHSKTFNDIDTNNKCTMTDSRDYKCHIKTKSQFCFIQPKKKNKKCINVIKDSPLLQNDQRYNESEQNENNLFQVMMKINLNQRTEININQKEVFKKLRGDIQKSEYKIKTILDDLRRTQTLNDEGLKRKGFIMKIGCITGEYLK